MGDAPGGRRTILAVACVFLANGFIIGAWGVRVAEVQRASLGVQTISKFIAQSMNPPSAPHSRFKNDHIVTALHQFIRCDKTRDTRSNNRDFLELHCRGDFKTSREGKRSQRKQDTGAGGCLQELSSADVAIHGGFVRRTGYHHRNAAATSTLHKSHIAAVDFQTGDC